MMANPGKIARSIAPVLFLVALSAQKDAAPRQSEIVVTGKRVSHDEARKMAAAFVRSTGAANGNRAAARWLDPICPRVLGLDAKLAGIVEAQVRAAARAAEAPVAPESCATNIVITFSSDAASLTRGIAARRARALAEVPVRERAALLEGTAPIRWWYQTELMGKDGDRLLGAEPTFVTGIGGAPGKVLPGSGESTFRALHSNSVVSTQTVRALRKATIIVDANRSAGVTLDAVANYVSLVALAEIRPTSELQTGSILGLFGSDEAPRRLSDWDTKFLRELYQLPLDREARHHRRRLASALLSEETER